jgi:hypothetical protein
MRLVIRNLFFELNAFGGNTVSWRFPRGARGSCTVQAFDPWRRRVRLTVYLMGVVSALSLVSRTKTASSFAGSVLLALRLIEWVAPGGSDQLSPAR